LTALGTHLLVELKNCNTKILNDVKKIEEILVSAAQEAKATIIETKFHKFSPYGISGVVVIAESHLTIHTWPEHGYAAVDIFTCGETLHPSVAADYIIARLQSKNPSIVEMKRGLLPTERVRPIPNSFSGEIVHYGRVKELQMVS